MSLAKRALRRLRGDDDVDEDEHNIGRYEVVVRDVEPGGPTPWGKRIVENYESRGVEDYGVGTDLFGPAMDEVKRRVDPYAHEPGTVVAEIVVDCDAWEYEVELKDVVDESEEVGA